MTQDLTQYFSWTKEKLRDELVNNGMSRDEAENIRNKQDLVTALGETLNQAGPSYFDSLERERVIKLEYDDENHSTEVPIPQYGSVQWQDYILSMLQPDEFGQDAKGNSHPKACGLRRVANLVLGPIIESGPISVVAPNNETHQATVTYEIKFLWLVGFNGKAGWFTENEIREAGNSIRVFREVADASILNTPKEYAKHASATASTRAEGRALRKALCLNVVTAEEMQSTTEEEIEEDSLVLIQPSQKRGLENIASTCSIDLEKATQEFYAKELSALTKIEARDMLQKFNVFRNKLDTIPVSIKKEEK
jgi:hypothetical protein